MGLEGTEGSADSIHTCRPTKPMDLVGGEGRVQVQITPVDPPDETAVPILNIPGGQQILPLKTPCKNGYHYCQLKTLKVRS